MSNLVIIQESPGKGLGVFAREDIPTGTEIYTPVSRVRIPRATLADILATNAGSPETCRRLLAWGWGEGEDFILPLGIESFINHSDKPNVIGRRTIGMVAAGEELVEDYNEFDKKEDWYCRLAEQYGAWIA